MRTLRVNGQITEVKQLKTKTNCKMGDHLESIHFAFFSLARNGRSIRKISQILLFSWNFGKLNCQQHACRCSQLYHENKSVSMTIKCNEN